MENKVIYNNLGMIAYQEAWDLQKKLLAGIQDIKRVNKELPACEQTTNYNYLLFCEHPHVYTLGKSGHDSNLLVNEEFLREKGASFVRIDRGGDITYHGPGQIVGYPIIDLESFSLGVKEYVFRIEEAIITLLRKYGIESERLDGSTGVWLDTNVPGKTRKICAIGVKVSRSVTMHGFAFNVNTNLDYYRYINPCGFTDKGVTSMQQELGRTLDFEQVKNELSGQLSEEFAFEFEDLSS